MNLCDFNHQSTVFCSVILQDVPNPDSVILVKTALFQAWWEPGNESRVELFFLPTYIHTIVHTCTSTHIHTCAHTSTHTHTHAHTHTHTSIHAQMHTSIHTHTHTHKSQAMWPLAPLLFPTPSPPSPPFSPGCITCQPREIYSTSMWWRAWRGTPLKPTMSGSNRRNWSKVFKPQNIRGGKT